MGVYKIIWLGATGAVAATGIAVGATSLHPSAIISLGLFALVLGPLVAAGTHAQRHPGTTTPLVFVFAVTTALVTAAVAISGLIAVLGALGLLAVAALAAVSPPVLRRLGRGRPRAATTPPPPAPVPEPPPVPVTPSFASLTDSELCWRWRTSFAALQHSASPSERARLIETRAALLDELASRDPAGFARWIDSGARAASDPSRFLTPHRGKQPPH